MGNNKYFTSEKYFLENLLYILIIKLKLRFFKPNYRNRAKLEKISAHAFATCEKIADLELPDSLLYEYKNARTVLTGRLVEMTGGR